MKKPRIQLYRFCADEDGVVLHRHIPTYVECWFDNIEQKWILYVADSNRDQVADAEYSNTVEGAKEIKEQLENAIELNDFCISGTM